MTNFDFKVVQNDMIVARAMSEDKDVAYREALHYAWQYVSEGPVKIMHKRRIVLEMKESKHD